MTRALHIVSKSKQRLTFLGALVVVAVTATAASAYFTATGAGTVTASTGTLTAPRNPSASAGGAHVTVELDAALLSNGTPAQSYTVERYTGTGSDDGPACGGATVASSAENACASDGMLVLPLILSTTGILPAYLFIYLVARPMWKTRPE